MTCHQQLALNRVYHCDALQGISQLLPGSVQCCVTSPPYWHQRDYQTDGQYGMEGTPEAYVAQMVQVFSAVRRVLRPDGLLWLNMGDTYWGSGKAGKSPSYQQRHHEFGRPSTRPHRFAPPTGGPHAYLKNKDLVGIPWLLALALQKDGWWLRQDIIWQKPAPMPESVTDRCTRCHEYIFLLAKSRRYYYDAQAIQSISADGRSLVNCRSVWSIKTKPGKYNHYAPFPAELPERCIRASSRPGDLVLDPFMGVGTTAIAAISYGRQAIGFDINDTFVTVANQRIDQMIGHP